MNYKIKDLTQAKTLNGGVAIEVQDGDAMSTYATLDQVKAFLGEMQPIVLKITMAVNGSLTPNMTPEEITEAYGMIVADPTRNVPVVVLTTPFDRIYLLPQTYSISLLSVLKRVTATYRKNGYITPYSLVLTDTEITFADSEDPIAPSDLARLDNERKYVIPSQIAPLQGRQTGVLTEAGYFSSNVSGLLFEGDRTLEVLFWTGDDVTSRQIVAIQANNAILPRVDILNNQIHVMVSGTFTYVPATANTRYHIVIPRDVDAASAFVFVNGTQYTKTVPTQYTEIAAYFNLGRSRTSGNNFKGRLVSARLFNYALSAAEADELWNLDEPDRYMLPPTGAMRNGLVAEYIPAGLLEDKWRDTSGASLDLPYIPEQTGGKAQFDYQWPPQTLSSALIAPLQGRQSGVQIIDGVFRSQDASLCIDGDRTLAVCFFAGQDTYTVGYAFNDHVSGDPIHGLMVRIGFGGVVADFCGKNIFAPNAVAGRLYLAVIAIRKGVDAVGYLNGAAYPAVTDQSRYTAPDAFLIGAEGKGTLPFNGRLVSARLFNYALSAAEAAELWNLGDPGRYMLPPTGAMRNGLVAEYIPAGLLEDKWRDTSGAGLDLPYVPAQTGGKAQLDYQQLPLPDPEEIYSYGIEWDTADPSPQCHRIGNPALHRSLPVQSAMRGCLLDDDGNVVEYLNPTSWEANTRDGSKGQVMVELPEHYRKCETIGTKQRVRISEYPLPGYHLVRKRYVSAYEATVRRSTNTLCSVVNMDADYRGGNNNSAYDGTYRTFLGRPATNISRTNFRNYARNRKFGSAKWNCMTYDIHKEMYWLFAIEYATRNSQAAVNAQKDGSGYAQGGLGAGVTTLDWNNWYNFNGAGPFIPCGYTDGLGNGTGEVEFSMPDEYGGGGQTVKVPRYRGIENPFGHEWKLVDGINIRVSPDQENGGDGLSKVFVCNDPAQFKDDGYSGYTYVGNQARTEGNIKEVIFGEGGEITASVIGGSGASYFCDRHYTNIPASESLRGLSTGGNANGSSAAGLTSGSSNSIPSSTYTYVGSRLCFIPDADRTGIVTPSGDPMHDMYLAADPQLSWNAEKGCWVHCGVEVSVEQNRLDWIYSMSTFSAFCRSGMERCPVVVNYHKAGASPTTLDVAGLCTLCSRLEVVNIGQYVNMSNIDGLFLGCKKLKTVLGYMELNNATREYNSFYECESLESIQLRRINAIPTIDFSYSPNLLPEVFTYAIANAQSNKTATTNFILHPTVYAKIAQATEGDWLSVKQAFEGTELFTYSQA